MYYPIHISIDQIIDKLKIEIRKGDQGEFLNHRVICVCGFLFKLPIINRSETKFTYSSLYQTNYSREHVVEFELPVVNGSGQVMLALSEFEGNSTELTHIFEYSLFNYTNFFNINKQYDYHCDYSKL